MHEFQCLYPHQFGVLREGLQGLKIIFKTQYGFYRCGTNLKWVFMLGEFVLEHVRHTNFQKYNMYPKLTFKGFNVRGIRPDHI